MDLDNGTRSFHSNNGISHKYVRLLDYCCVFPFFGTSKCSGRYVGFFVR